MQKITKTVKIKNVLVGGGNKIAVQSMTNCDTLDADAVKTQIQRLVAEKCDVIRLAVENQNAVKACREYIDFSPVPLVADIHFDYRLAVSASDAGFPKIRINPGNIGGENNLKEVISACKANNTAIRIGINGGSLEKDLLKKYGVCAQSLAKSALRSVAFFEKNGFENLIVSVKSSDVSTTVAANRLLSARCCYPLHIGVTETGNPEMGAVKSAIGIGALLSDGIGDTVRVSLTADPVEEVRLARNILKSLNKIPYCRLISCPTCSRCKYDLAFAVKEIAEFVKDIEKDLTVAVMGCAVNGPGEAREADIGAAGAGENAVIFKKGAIVKTVPFAQIVPELKSMIKDLLDT